LNQKIEHLALCSSLFKRLKLIPRPPSDLQETMTRRATSDPEKSAIDPRARLIRKRHVTFHNDAPRIVGMIVPHVPVQLDKITPPAETQDV
jgi:hypothetical protein